MNPADNGLNQDDKYSSLESDHASAKSTSLSQEIKPSSFFYSRISFLISSIALVVIVLVGLVSYGLSVFTSHSQKTPQSVSQLAANYTGGNLSLQNLKVSPQLELGETNQLTINGQLDVNKTLVLSPSSTPTNPTDGEIFYNQTTNQPYYFNGTRFVSLGATAPQGVVSLGGSTGVISLSNGLQIAGNQLSVSSTLLQRVANSAVNGPLVTSLQGLTGKITVSGSANQIVVNTASGSIALSLPQSIGSSSNVQFGSLSLGSGDLTLTPSAVINTDNISTVNNGDSLVFNASNNVTFENQNGANTFSFPTSGGSGQVICTTAITCASGGGQAVILEPTGVQTASANKNSIFINKAAGTGNLIDLQTGGIDAFVINNTGDTTISNLNVSNSLTSNNLTPSGALTVGATGQSFLLQGTGASTITATSSGHTTTLSFTAPTAADSIVFPDASGTVCLTVGNCLGGGGGGANTALSNLASVAINTTLLPGAAGTINLGSGTLPFGQLYIAGASGTPGTNNFDITGTSTGGTRTITLPDASGTVCLESSGSCGFATSGSGVTSVNTLTGALTVNNVTTSGGNTITINNAKADGSTEGIATFNATNFSDNGAGVINTVQNINSTATPTFGGVDTNNITPSGALTVGATGQSFLLQGTGASTITATSSGHTTTLSFTAPTAADSIVFPDASGTVCLTVGNCLGGGGGGANTALSNLASVAINTTLLPGAAGTINLGSGTLPFGQLYIAGASGTPGTNNFDITGTSTGGTRTITLPDASGTVCLESSGSCGFATSGSGVTSVNTLTGALTVNNVTTSGGNTITINNAKADGSTEGIATFNATNFSDNGAGVINTVQNINSTATPTFGGVDTNNITPSGALTVGATGQSFLLQGTGASTITATSSGHTTTLSFTAPTAADSIVFPDASGTVCLTVGNCLGGGGGGANTALSNLASVAINTTLLPGAAGTINLGSGTLPFGQLYIAGASGTPGTNNFDITGTSTGGTRTITLPDASGTVCLESSGSCGFAPSSGSGSYIDNQSALTQAANYDIQGTSSTAATAVIEANNGGTGNILNLQNGSGVNVVTVGNTGNTTLENSTNSITAFQLQNSDGESILGGDTTATTNYITDADFALGSGNCPLTDWAKVGSPPTTCAQNTTATNTYEGQTSLQLVTTSAAGQGVSTTSFTSAPPTAASGAGEYYTVSFYIMQTSGTAITANNLQVKGTQGANNSTCTGSASQTLSASGFEQVSCTLTFTATGTISTLAISSLDAHADTFYIDGVQLQSASASTGTVSAFQEGNLSLRGVITNPVAFQNTTNSTTAFQVQNAIGISFLTVDTLNERLYVGPVAGDTVGAVLVLGNKTNSGDPPGVNGAMYYNSNLNAFRCYQNGTWYNCLNFYTPAFIGYNGAPNSAAGDANANQAYLYAVTVPVPVTLTGMRFQVATQGSGNHVDVGLYDNSGNRLASSGSTAVPAVGPATVNFTASATIQPGIYWLAFAVDSTTPTFPRYAINASIGAYTFASSFPLPASLTFPGTDLNAGNYYNVVGIVSGGLSQ